MTRATDGHPVVYLWGKLGRPIPDQLVGYHPLVCHMIDAAMVARLLWDEVVSDAFKRDVLDSFGLDGRARDLVALLVALHDLGKAAPEFVAKWRISKEVLLHMGYDFPTIVHPRAAPHGRITARCLYQALKLRGVAPLPSGEIAHVLGGHHGIFVRLEETRRGIDQRELGSEKWQDIRSQVLELLLELLGVDLCPALLDRLGQSKSCLMKLAGLTSVADWIASCEEFFPYAIAEPSDPDTFDFSDYLELSRSRALEALTALGWLDWKPHGRPSSFAELFGFKELRPLQETVAAIAGRGLEHPILMLIEAPMGDGKTEAAFFLQDRLQASAGQKGMYVALPTQATSNQMFDRLVSFLKARYPQDKVNLHLIHGQAGLDERYLQLRLACEDETVGGNSGRVVAEEWFTPRKRGLLAPFAVGTLDQALLSVLQVKHGFVRLFGLAGKVVVIDEVHSYDVYTSTLLDRLIEWLSALGSSVILLSATLPRKRTEELLQKYAARRTTLTACDYPRLTWLERGGEPKSIPFEAGSRRRFKIRHVGAERRAVAEKLAELIGKYGGCAAWICNTVGKAQTVFELLAPLCSAAGIGLSLLHARFPFEERQRRERQALDDFGKGSLKPQGDPGHRRRPEKAILVVTQIVEQSLDLDFDLMLSDLPPIDLLLQRLGRLHRHEGRVRPKPFMEPMVWLIDPELSSHGLPDLNVDGHVYEEYVLLRSWLTVRALEVIEIPGDIKDLIEVVYSPEGLTERDRDLPDEWRLRLKEAWDEAKTKREDDERKARGRVVPRPDDCSHLSDWYNADLREDNPEASLRTQAATRLCRPSVSLVCLHDAGSGRVSLDPEGTRVLDLADGEEPGLETARAILGRAVTVTHQGVVGYFDEVPAPAGWRKSSLLRYHRPVIFSNGRCRVGGWEIELHPELGVRIFRGTEVDQND